MNNLHKKNRTRFKIKKVSSRKRLTVFRSNNHLYAQIINDEQGLTIACVSTLEKSFKNKKNKSRKELAEDLGKEIAKRSIKNGIKEVAFDKGKYKYHGIIKILADAARTGGLDF